MSRSIVRISLLIGMLALALWLYWDSTTFALYKADPSTGRGRACFTQLEMLLGNSKPLDWMRYAELGVAAILSVSSVLLLTQQKREKPI